MTDTHLDVLGEGVQSFVDEIAEEGQMVEDAPIALLQVLLFQV